MMHYGGTTGLYERGADEIARALSMFDYRAELADDDRRRREHLREADRRRRAGG